ncbi:hypothetical protein KFE98_15575 [bacterium SCSIO 12741]|nr:hypothetical protein KFE98_15575 [bacterium SCSIO 12741]
MKGISVWWWLIIPIGLIVFLVFWFDLNTIDVKLSEDEPEILEARVMDVTFDQEVGAWTTYVYERNGQNYWGRAKLKQKEYWCFPGATLFLTYNEEKPSKSRISSLPKPDQRLGQFSFYHPKKVGMEELELIEDAFVWKKRGAKGVLEQKVTGIWYWSHQDTIQLDFFSFTAPDTTPAFHQLVWLKDSSNVQIWRNIQNQKIYKLTNAGWHE